VGKSHALERLIDFDIFLDKGKKGGMYLYSQGVNPQRFSFHP
jgi:hypothetical protein